MKGNLKTNPDPLVLDLTNEGATWLCLVDELLLLFRALVGSDERKGCAVFRNSSDAQLLGRLALMLSCCSDI